MHKIMVADDKVVIAAQLEELLTSLGYEVVGKAYSGESAVEKARRLRPDLILMDIAIPGKIDGINAAETIKTELDIPVIFLTAYADDKFVERAKNVAPFGYILKPFQGNEIKAAIELALYRKDSERRLRKQAEEVLRESEERFRILFEAMAEGVILIAPGGQIVQVNPAAERILGFKRSEIEGCNYVGLEWEIIHLNGTPMPPEEMPGIRAMNEKRPVKDAVMGVKRSNDLISWLNASATPLINEGPRLMGVICTFEDITRSKRVEEETKASLREKDMLLKEIHHRIKNNLQIVSSLLDMHSLRTYDPQTVDLLNEVRSKIHAMALVHSQLYQSDRLTQVNMGSYIHELVAHLSHVYENRNKSVTSDIEHSGVYLSITQAISCALVLHELVSNVFKHAFEGRQRGLIKISMRESANDKVSIRVEDDGVGMPEEIDVYKTDTMGLKLVRNLVLEQLRGNIQINRNKGTKIFIDFKLLKEVAEHV
ncbi:MAG: response regulator [Halobacteriota archaeon]